MPTVFLSIEVFLPIVNNPAYGTLHIQEIKYSFIFLNCKVSFSNLVLSKCGGLQLPSFTKWPLNILVGTDRCFSWFQTGEQFTGWECCCDKIVGRDRSILYSIPFLWLPGEIMGPMGLHYHIFYQLFANAVEMCQEAFTIIPKQFRSVFFTNNEDWMLRFTGSKLYTET